MFVKATNNNTIHVIPLRTSIPDEVEQFTCWTLMSNISVSLHPMKHRRIIVYMEDIPLQVDIQHIVC